MKSMETGRQDGGSDKNHAPFSVGETGNISRKFLTIILKIFDKNFERLHYGVLEYIHKVRLEHAKDMLKNDVRIKNIALDVGYTDAQAFTRAFKRYEGITPSQYKELISKNEA